MIVPFVLLLATLVARLAGRLGTRSLDSWPAAVRAGLAAMLTLTASAHFNSMRHDLVKMVPPGIPEPMAMITFTGVCELAGAAGLMIPRLRVVAAWCLIVLFLALLPANIYAAREGIRLMGNPATPLWIRIPEQAAFIALTWWSGIHRARR
ncbi:hypothetical protein Pan44_14610 [Caulifigura coniformis]|uniref:DoxX n=1 Tax=Caulifigura coniformis TaxID=2527983 RepID=A0A517SBG2_9PLAN|nr:DoxX family protein [Caulifigura coniformis]QDT53444.1 hypothetical protein Pan44_14610 [Caulifigura coniformis]